MINKSIEGDNAAFENLADHYLKILYNYIYSHIGNQDDANDIIQESILSIWQCLKEFDRKSSFKTWAFAITRRKIADFFRKKYNSSKPNNIDISECEDLIGSEDFMGDLIEKAALQDALGMLDKCEKEMVFLVFAAEMKYSEVSFITGAPLGTVKSRMSSIRKKLRSSLEEEVWINEV